MDRLGFLLYFALVVLVVVLAKRKGREAFPWLVYAGYLVPIALIHVLRVPAEREPRSSTHDFFLGLFGAGLVGTFYMLAIFMVFGMKAGLPVYYTKEAMIARGMAIVIAGVAGARWQWNKSRAQSYGFLATAALYGFGTVAGIAS